MTMYAERERENFEFCIKLWDGVSKNALRRFYRTAKADLSADDARTCGK